MLHLRLQVRITERVTIPVFWAWWERLGIHELTATRKLMIRVDEIGPTGPLVTHLCAVGSVRNVAVWCSAAQTRFAAGVGIWWVAVEDNNMKCLQRLLQAMNVHLLLLEHCCQECPYFRGGSWIVESQELIALRLQWVHTSRCLSRFASYRSILAAGTVFMVATSWAC